MASFAILLPIGGTIDASPFVVLVLLLSMLALGPAMLANPGVQPRMLALAAPAIVVAAVYLVANVDAQRSGHPTDPHVFVDHFTAIAVFGASVVVGALLGSTSAQGGRIAAATTATSVALFGAVAHLPRLCVGVADAVGTCLRDLRPRVRRRRNLRMGCWSRRSYQVSRDRRACPASLNIP